MLKDIGNLRNQHLTTYPCYFEKENCNLLDIAPQKQKEEKES